MADQPIDFDEGKPFYPMVGAFLVSVSSCAAVFNPSDPMQLKSDQYVSLTGVRGEDKHVFPLDIQKQAQAGQISMPHFVATCCQMLLNTAFESVKDSNTLSPTFEFFRHVRNASSHGNLFYFTKKEPRLPAAWRGFTINHKLLGTSNPLHGTPCLGPVLGPADLLDLLKDIETELSAVTPAA